MAATTSFMSTGVGSSSSEMTLRPEIPTNYYLSFRKNLKPLKHFPGFEAIIEKHQYPRFCKLANIMG